MCHIVKITTIRELKHATTTVLSWVAGGVFAGAAPPLAEILTEAERLSALHTEKLGTRGLDILHLSSALVLGRSVFLTLDHRQIALAKATGLNVSAL